MHVCVLNMANNYYGKQHMLLCQEGKKGKRNCWKTHISKMFDILQLVGGSFLSLFFFPPFLQDKYGKSFSSFPLSLMTKRGGGGGNPH